MALYFTTRSPEAVSDLLELMLAEDYSLGKGSLKSSLLGGLTKVNSKSEDKPLSSLLAAKFVDGPNLWFKAEIWGK